jgi:glycosyltransferase involved in cell wall biosynthesis
MQSELNATYNLVPINTNVHKTLDTLGKVNFDKLKKNIAVYKLLYNKLKEHKPQCAVIPISQTTVGFIKDAVFIAMCKWFGVKVIVHLHGSVLLDWYNKTNPIIKHITKKILTNTNGAIVLGNNLKYIFEPFLPLHKIHVVPNGANYTFNTLPKNTATLQLLYLGNLQATKGIIDVIDALVLLKNKHNTLFECNIIGAWRDDVTKNYCTSKVAEHGLNVHFRGVVTGTDKNQYYEQAHVFVFAPRAPEGHPWVIVEAMAAGLPIISTNKGAIVESVIDGYNGYIVGDKCPEAIAQHLHSLATDNNLLSTLSSNAIAHYNANFTETKMVQQLAEAIKSCV